MMMHYSFGPTKQLDAGADTAGWEWEIGGGRTSCTA